LGVKENEEAIEKGRKKIRDLIVTEIEMKSL
jgi:hypothetical protein